MNRLVDLWSRRAKLWASALVFLLLNLGLLLGYRVVIQARIAAVSGALEERQEELADLTSRREQRESLVARAVTTEDAIQRLRLERLGTEAERLTEIMLRVKNLLSRAGLDGPESIRYAEEPVEEHGLVRETISFGVRGDYEELRRFINFLELSERFLILEEIGVTESDPGVLSVRLRLSTLFHAPGVTVREET
ncbi:MAG: hypothetical protein R3234_12255 [Thermoanaerobaculia bacterium]|nr:hypothetical protein [Thermoanaerobaculia bacterium]